MNMTTQEVMTLLEANLRRYEKKHGIVMDREVMVLKLMEEVGEFTQALITLDNKCRVKKRLDPETARANVEKELSDVLSAVLGLAVEMKIDIFGELYKKTLQKGEKFLEEGSNDKNLLNDSGHDLGYDPNVFCFKKSP